MKGSQQDSDGIAPANQSLPLAQSQSEQNVDCGSSDIQTVASQPQDTSNVGEVSSSHEPVSTTSGVSSSVNYSDSDDADDFPAFEYSAESMQVAKDSKDSPETTSNEAEQSTAAEENMENDEDLVQLDDDEHFGNETGISEENANQTEADKSIESPVASPETTTNMGGSESPLNNERDEPSSNEPKITEDVSESEEQEEQIAENSKAQSITNGKATDGGSKENRTRTGIEGMDTEMISEDEHELHDDQVSKDLKADQENNNQKSERDDSFKKVNKSNKDRNYRDKKDKTEKKQKAKSRRSKSRSSSSSSKSRSWSRSRSRTRSRSQSRSRNRNRRNDRRPRRKENREKRREIQRYDVRNVIERQPRNIKDRYGRDESRPRSISRSPSPGNFEIT